MPRPSLTKLATLAQPVDGDVLALQLRHGAPGWRSKRVLDLGLAGLNSIGAAGWARTRGATARGGRRRARSRVGRWRSWGDNLDQVLRAFNDDRSARGVSGRA